MSREITVEEKLDILAKKVIDLEDRLAILESNAGASTMIESDWIADMHLDPEQENALKMMRALGMEKKDIKDLIIRSIK